MKTKTLMNVALFAVSLLWLSPMFAANQKPHAAPAVRRSANGYVGVASWYGIHHQGRKMSNGQRFDREKLTAASWHFPLGTSLWVVNLKNGNAV